MLSGISAVAFDLDGTLYPNYRLYIRLLPFLLRHWRLLAAFGKARNIIRQEQEQSPPDQLVWLQDKAIGFHEYQAGLTANLLREQPDRIQEKIDTLIYRGWEPHFAKIKLFPHVRELLEALKTAGFRLGLLSDFPLQAKLKHLDITGYWDTALCSENSGALKPAARPFADLAEALQCPPEQILYVGNNRRYDAAGAKRAGMKTALITGRFTAGRIAHAGTGADYIFHDYRQLHNFVLK